MAKTKWLNRFNSLEREKPEKYYKRDTSSRLDTASYIPVNTRILQSQIAGLKGLDLQAHQFDYAPGTPDPVEIPKVTPTMTKGYDPVELQRELNDLIERRKQRIENGSAVSPTQESGEAEKASPDVSKTEEKPPEAEGIQ